jgi:hypothetical protein
MIADERAPEALPQIVPEPAAFPERARLGTEQDGSAARGGPETSDRNEPIDEVKWYLENVPDPDDEKWRPTP